MKRTIIWKRIGIAIAAAFVLFCGYAYYEYRQFEKGLEDLARGLGDLARAFDNVESPSSSAADSVSNNATSTALIEADSSSKRD